MPQITLVQYPGAERESTLSAPCGKVHMALAFKGLEYETKTVLNPLQVKKVNPRGRVPALRIGDEVFVDSTDILTELDRRFPGLAFRVVDEQGRVRRHMHVFIGESTAAGRATAVPEGAGVYIVGALSGG